jgi:antitoxin (DNA-binding transcriptional repressor) of toxin-antitoxin stability system
MNDSNFRPKTEIVVNSILPLTVWANGTNVAAMKTVNVHEAKTHFSSLLARLEADSETIVICRNGEPVADLVPHQRRSRIKPHPVLGRMKIDYDPVEPLSHDEWPEAAR